MNALLISTYEMGRQPFGLASPAAWLRAAGSTVDCVDVSKEPLRDSLIAEADLVAFYLPMHTATRLAAPVIAKVRRLNPSARICAYGLYAPLNAELKADGTPDPEGKTGWFQRGGDAFKDPKTGLSHAFGNVFCGTNGIVDVWNGSAWQTQSCSPMSGTPPVFWPPAPGDPVGISAVTATPDGKSWWASCTRASGWPCWG